MTETKPKELAAYEAMQRGLVIDLEARAMVRREVAKIVPRLEALECRQEETEKQLKRAMEVLNIGAQGEATFDPANVRSRTAIGDAGLPGDQPRHA